MWLAAAMVYMSVSCTDATEIIKGVNMNPDLNEEARIGLIMMIKAATEDRDRCAWDENVI